MDRNKNSPLTRRDGAEDIAAFVEAAKKVPAAGASGRGRLIFALDATMSRQPTWDLAQSLQAKMFEAAGSLGGLDVQLVYFRGFNECRASSFVSGGQGLKDLMSRIEVRGGSTQIGRVLAHALSEAKRAKVAALIFIGDAMEENPDRLASLGGELALLGVKAFMFQEGRTPRRGARSARSPASPAGPMAPSTPAPRRGWRRCCARRRPMRRAATRLWSGRPRPTPRRGSCCRRCAGRELGLSLRARDGRSGRRRRLSKKPVEAKALQE